MYSELLASRGQQPGPGRNLASVVPPPPTLLSSDSPLKFPDLQMPHSYPSHPPHPGPLQLMQPPPSWCPLTVWLPAACFQAWDESDGYESQKSDWLSAELRWSAGCSCRRSIVRSGFALAGNVQGAVHMHDTASPMPSVSDRAWFTRPVADIDAHQHMPQEEHALVCIASLGLLTGTCKLYHVTESLRQALSTIATVSGCNPQAS
jgi:hypothetical protein